MKDGEWVVKSVSPYVIVEDVASSVEYYQRVFGGDVKILNKQDGTVMHAELHLGDSLIHFSATYGRQPVSENVKLIVQCESEDEIRTTYETLKADGEVTVELQDTFFGALHGQVVDHRNRICFILNYFKR